jgi:hypothetical protein
MVAFNDDGIWEVGDVGMSKTLTGRVVLWSSRMVADSCRLGGCAVSPGAEEMDRQGTEEVILQRLTPRLPVRARGLSSTCTPPPLTSTAYQFSAALGNSSDALNAVEGRQV